MADAPTPDIPSRDTGLLITEEMQDSYLTYAMSVIMARALPDVRDGLKPSQRRILVAMNDLNLGPRSSHRKCAKIAGDTSGNYHPHGEQTIYPTLVRLAQPWNMRYRLVDGQGNFGTIDGDPPAAMRYTEARMAAPAVEMLEDLTLDTVAFERNYDDTRDEPTVLPSKFPNLLVNGSTGIAVGLATNILPHNLGEICEAVVAVIDKPEITLPELMKIVPGPDLPTGGIICGRRGIREAYTTGRGRVIVRGKVHVEEIRGGRQQIVVDEVPFQVLKNTITTRAAKLVKDGTIAGISEIRDESDRKNPLRLVIELRRDADHNVVCNQLYRYTPLQSTLSIMNIALVDRRPQTLSLKRMLELFVEHRKDVIRRRTRFLLRRARARAHVLEGLILAVGDIDRIIETIKASPDPKAAKLALMKLPLRLTEQATMRRLLPESFVRRVGGSEQFLTGPQADAILTMQLQRLTGLEIERLATDYAKLVEEIEGYEALLADERLILDIIREDMFELKERYADPRRTQITGAVQEFDMEQLIAEEQVVVTLTHGGYIKRTPTDAYRKQGRGGRGVRGSGESRQEDFLEHLFVASTHDYLLLFTDRGRVYWLKVYDIPSMARTGRGRSLANLLRLSGESPSSVLAVREFDDEHFVVMATAGGTIKKTPLSAFSHPRATGIIAISLDPDDELIGCERTSGHDQVVLATRDGLAIRFEEEKVRPMGRSARGVRGIRLERDDRVVDMVVVDPGATLLTVCENGYGKRTDFDEYRVTGRGGKGVINIRTTERNGKVVALRTVTDDDELMMITAGGIMLRTGLREIRTIGRATQGVRLIRPDEGDKVVAVARIVTEDEDAAAHADAAAPPADAEPSSAEPDEAPEPEPSAPDAPDEGPDEDTPPDADD